MKIVNLFPTKTCSIFVAITLLLIPSNDAKAVLVPTVNSDTLTNLIVSWTWDPENFNDVSQPVLVNWRVSLNIIPFPPNNQNSEDFSILLTARHITDPHPAINELGGGLTVTYLKTIDSDPFLANCLGHSHPREKLRLFLIHLNIMMNIVFSLGEVLYRQVQKFV